MTTHYKLVHFVADPFLGTRTPIAAIVRHGEELLVARASKIPDADCLGGSSSLELAHALVDALHGIKDFEKLPSSLGPHAVLGACRQVPDQVDDPVRWLQRHVLPHDESEKVHRVEAIKRPTYGWRFLQNLGVERFVRKRFRPELLWDRPVSEPLSVLKPISHFVLGSENVMLMEPVRLEGRQFADDLQEVGLRFAAYHYYIKAFSATALHPIFVAYMLPSGVGDEQRVTARDTLAGSADAVVDCTRMPERQRFAEDVRRIGHSGNPQLL
jgi:hypothetical protein